MVRRALLGLLAVATMVATSTDAIAADSDGGAEMSSLPLVIGGIATTTAGATSTGFGVWLLFGVGCSSGHHSV